MIANIGQIEATLTQVATQYFNQDDSDEFISDTMNALFFSWDIAAILEKAFQKGKFETDGTFVRTMYQIQYYSRDAWVRHSTAMLERLVGLAYKALQPYVVVQATNWVNLRVDDFEKCVVSLVQDTAELKLRITVTKGAENEHTHI